METERIALSQRERDRLRVLHEVKQKQITQIAAARAAMLRRYNGRRRARSRAGRDKFHSCPYKETERGERESLPLGGHELSCPYAGFGMRPARRLS